ncbi:hypothetical protein WR25_22603 [Diploscapter pachys]|uniref:G-protein coupled receptors family 1 profile domain-containing protein n=1 Tax=Diploscapter pachys TaxID=2018661 RepID=A0A2A2JP45_9BILA|nr:hypothetical protein WR25_22603 [Diploscapter pachys]
MTDSLECDDFQLFDPESNFTFTLNWSLSKFKQFYSPIHIYLSLLLCVFGLLFNTLHILVLTRPRMRTSSVHSILVIIALSDMGTMTSYLIYILRFELAMDRYGYSYEWAAFLKLHVVLSIGLHALTLYFVVLMAFIRFSALRIDTSKWLEKKRALTAALIIFIYVILLCVPTFLTHKIRNDEIHQLSTPENRVIKYNIDMVANCFMIKANLWLTGIMLKALPCGLLFWFTLALVSRLNENQRKREKLVKEERRRGDMTTYMLFLMVTVFLLMELPQGIIAILNALFTSQFHSLVYQNLADILDLFSLINCYVAFLVYVSTCSLYRETLWSLFPNFRYYQ